MKIATWNVNSIRTRLDHVTAWLQTTQVDVLCLQETKVEDGSFPRSPFEAMGLHLYISGQKSYNGVAIISRTPLEEVTIGFQPVLGDRTGELDTQKRAIAATCNGIRIVNIYLPNGSAVGSDKYLYKLQWMAALRDYLSQCLEKQPHLVLCGDFNVAPEDIDIHDPSLGGKSIMASVEERQALAAIAQLGFQDAFRKFTTEGGHFSWWDYRAAAFRRNLGWRIDHHYVSTALGDRLADCTIDVNPRKLTKPSDHAPVIVELT